MMYMIIIIVLIENFARKNRTHLSSYRPGVVCR